MTTKPAQPPAGKIPKQKQTYSPRYYHNVRAMPQISEHDRDADGPLPLLTLSGAWLRRFGFDVGEQVRIEASPGQILLRPVWTSAYPSRKEPEKPAVRYAEVEQR